MHCGLWLLTGPFQMLLLQTDWQMFAPFGDVGRAYQCMEEPTPRLNEFGRTHNVPIASARRIWSISTPL